MSLLFLLLPQSQAPAAKAAPTAVSFPFFFSLAAQPAPVVAVTYAPAADAASFSPVGSAVSTAFLTVALDGVTLASAATAPEAATDATTLAPVTLSSSATAPEAATDATTLADVTLASTATAPEAATDATTLAPVTLSSSATDPEAATLTATLTDATLSSAATAPEAATDATTLAPVTLSSSATAPEAATDATTLDPVTLASTGGTPAAAANADFSATLADAGLVSTGGAAVATTAGLAQGGGINGVGNPKQRPWPKTKIVEAEAWTFLNDAVCISAASAVVEEAKPKQAKRPAPKPIAAAEFRRCLDDATAEATGDVCAVAQAAIVLGSMTATVTTTATAFRIRPPRSDWRLEGRERSREARQRKAA